MSRKILLPTAFGLLAAVAFCLPAESASAATPNVLAPTVVTAAKFMRTQPLRNMRWQLPPLMQRILHYHKGPVSKTYLKALRQHLIETGQLPPPGKIRGLSHSGGSPGAGRSTGPAVHDPVLQRSLPAAPSATSGFTHPVVSFDGLGHSTGLNIQFLPPDAKAAVGQKYVIEAVNSSFAIYDKSGRMILGPAPLNALWTGFGGPCENLNDGYPAVLYDQLAHRWIISRYAFPPAPGPSGTPQYQCVAVSQTNDPTGGWYLYAYELTNHPLSSFSMDGPKMGVWPDAYYSADAYTYFVGYQVRGTLFVAFDRAAMLAGDPDAQVVTFDKPNARAALPATLEGATPPPKGAPGLFAEYTHGGFFRPIQELGLFQLHVDWSDPTAATLSGPTTIRIDPFTVVCPTRTNAAPRDPTCLTQPRTPQQIDAVGDRLMAGIAYRNFGDHQALVVNQTVGVGMSGNPPSGIRWYELDAPEGSTDASAWTIVQQSTLAPADGNSRWLGSIAMDLDGDIALGYSLVGPATDPSIAYTGRHAADPAGEMTEPETILQAGGGDQTGSYLWGDASKMAVAPDGCTFWYTNEYYAESSPAFWSTHIGAFAFPDCTPAPQGTLAGSVTDAANGKPIAGAKVVLNGDIVAKTDDQGEYSIELAVGDYSVTTRMFGYAPANADVKISNGAEAERNLQLSAAPTATVSGQVADGSGHGWPLYAEIKVFTPGFGQVADVWSAPQTGDYQLKLPMDSSYSLRASDYRMSYAPASATVAALGGAVAQNFALKTDGSCTTPGYYSFTVNQNFNGPFPPKGWTVANEVAGSPLAWKLNTQWLSAVLGAPIGNFTGGSGTAAAVDEQGTYSTNPPGFYVGDFDTSLISPPIAVTSLPAQPVLRFRLNYQPECSGGCNSPLDVDIRADGGAWQNVAEYLSNSYGGNRELPGTIQSYDLAKYIPAGAKTVQVRWHLHYIAGTGVATMNYAQIDDVRIGSCSLVAGGLVEGQVRDANTADGVVGATVSNDSGYSTTSFSNAADPNLPAGYYFLFAPAGKHSLDASAMQYQNGAKSVKVSDNRISDADIALGAGQVAVAPASVSLHVTVNMQQEKTLTLTNTGSAAAHYRVMPAHRPMPSSTLAGPAVAAVPFPAFSVGILHSSVFKASLCPPPAGTDCGAQNAPWAATTATFAAAAPGTLVNTFLTYLWGGYGLGFDRDEGNLWVGSISLGTNGGDDRDYQFLPDGTPTGKTIDVSSISTHGFEADMAYDSNSGTFWQIGISLNSGFCIYELDPVTVQTTGRRICPDIDVPQTALAYDPTTDTWYTGRFKVPGINFTPIYHFDASGRVLDTSGDMAEQIIGLTYNPSTGDLYATASGQLPNVGVYDTRHNYALVEAFTVPGLAGLAGAGLSHDCEGHLWIATAANSNEVIEAESGEGGWCAFKQVPWLSEAPASGTVTAGDSATVVLAVNGNGRKPFTTTHTQLLVRTNTPYGILRVPVTVHWDAQPVDLTLTGKASPSPVRLGNVLTYTLMAKNTQAEGNGATTDTVLSYTLPAGVSYVSADGEGVSCTTPASTSSAPAVASTTGAVSCDLGTLAQGAAKTVTIAVNANAAGQLASTFKVSARESDSDASNNTLTLTTSVLGTADLKASVSGATITAGDTGTVHVEVTNAGPDAAADVKLKLSAGSAAKLQSATASQGSCTSSRNNSFECDLGELASGATTDVDIQVFGTYAGTSTLTGQVTTTATDPDAGNDTAQATITITEPSQPPSNNGGSGGFGGLGLGLLLALALAAVSMKNRRLRAALALNMGRRNGMSNRWMSAALVGAVLLVGAGIGLPLSARAAPASQGTFHQPLAREAMSPQSSLTLLSRAQEVGPHAEDSQISLVFGLELRNEAKLNRFLAQVQDPRSPIYHQWLTPAEFTAEYGPTQKQVAALKQFLSRWGIEVTKVSSNRLLVHTEGTTVAYEHALEVRINDYTLAGRSFYSTQDRPRLPITVAPLVVNVLGLNHGLRMVPLSFVKGRVSNAAVANAPPPSTTAYFNPHQIAKAYDWPDITNTDNGAGVSIAIMTALTPNADNPNYHTFWQEFGLPDHDINVISVGGSSGSGGGAETALDVEWSGAMAPGANLNVYVSANASIVTFATAYNQIVTDNNSQVMTTSWGLSEHAAPSLFESDENIFKEAVAQGISIFAAAGDNGAADCAPSPGYCPPGPNNADYPSSSVYITAANGTELTISDASGTYGSEQASIHTGGAISELFDKPAWQTGPGVPSNVSMRMNSDIAMNYGSVHPYLVFITGGQGPGFYGIGGTSAVAPQLAAMFADGISENGGVRLGQSNKLIYDDVNANKTNYGTDFHDVTSGCNGFLPDGTTKSCAGVAWDHPTGWGSPKAKSLLSHLGIQGPRGTITGTVTDSNGKRVAGAKVTTSPGARGGTTNEKGEYVFDLPVGSYTVTVSKFGFITGTATVTITDGNTITQDFKLQLAPKATVSGKVKDGSGHGWGLYAAVEATAAGVGEVTHGWTDPATGAYSLSMPKGYTYTVSVTPYSDYNPASVRKKVTGNMTKNFTLLTPACDAPGYHFAGISEDFNALPFPPDGWEVAFGPYSHLVDWRISRLPRGASPPPYQYGQDNVTGGSGSAAEASSGANKQYIYPYDTSLVSPEVAVSDLGDIPELVFRLNYQHHDSDALDLDIRVDGGAWKTIKHFTANYGGFYQLPGTQYKVDLAGYIPNGATDIQFRWRYYRLTEHTSDWYVQIDDVQLGTCETLSGGLVMGQVTDENTGKALVGATLSDGAGHKTKTFENAADSNLPVGYYILFASAGRRTLTASSHPYQNAAKTVNVAANSVQQENFALPAGSLASSPSILDVHVTVDSSKDIPFNLQNTGSAAAHYQVVEANLPVPPATGSLPTMAMSLLAPHSRGNSGPRRGHAFPAVASNDLMYSATLCGGQGSCSRSDVPASATATGPGSVVSEFAPTFLGVYGLGVDHDVGDLWVGSISLGGVGGDNLDHQFLFNGTATGKTIDVSSLPLGDIAADMAYDDNTGMFWQIGPATSTGFCIYEIDPVAMSLTGRKICPNLSFVQHALAYDPLTNTWYSGDFTGDTIYHFDSKGRILGFKNVGLPIIGLTFNPSTGNLFASVTAPSAAVHDVYVINPRNDYKILSAFTIPGLNGDAGAGLGHDCAGHLWLTDFIAYKVYEVNSGETGWCAFKQIPWITESPVTGTVATGAQAAVMLDIDGAGQQPFTTTRTQLIVHSNTPYGLIRLPVVVHWDPHSVSLALTGSAAPSPVQKGNGLVYTLTVKNVQAKGDGSATETQLAYQLPTGVSYVSGSGDGVTCTAPAGGSSPAPAAASAAGAVTCDLGTLPQGSSKTVTIAVNANAAGMLASTFKVSSREPDDDTSNNSLTLSTTVIGTADLGVSAKGVYIVSGDSGTVHFEVGNTGPDPASGVTLKITAGAGVTLQGATASQGSCKAASSGIECDLGGIATGGSDGVDVNVLGVTVGTPTVSGQATTSADDPDAGNNLAQATVTVRAPSKGGTNNNGGSGALNWLALAALLGLAFAVGIERRRRNI